eukprot:PhM_4_TR5813/c0_g1_i1/m.79971
MKIVCTCGTVLEMDSGSYNFPRTIEALVAEISRRLRPRSCLSVRLFEHNDDADEFGTRTLHITGPYDPSKVNYVFALMTGAPDITGSRLLKDAEDAVPPPLTELPHVEAEAICAFGAAHDLALNPTPRPFSVACENSFLRALSENHSVTLKALEKLAALRTCGDTALGDKLEALLPMPAEEEAVLVDCGIEGRWRRRRAWHRSGRVVDATIELCLMSDEPMESIADTSPTLDEFLSWAPGKAVNAVRSMGYSGELDDVRAVFYAVGMDVTRTVEVCVLKPQALTQNVTLNIVVPLIRACLGDKAVFTFEALCDLLRDFGRRPYRLGEYLRTPSFVAARTARVNEREWSVEARRVAVLHSVLEQMDRRLKHQRTAAPHDLAELLEMMVN